mmetsp:Transcript_13101/g.35676  ORF Transcript_13101/g.35676 Transcript_13101/m.35676 type:complete len:343 (-) Transcript_13101:289-1317(-)|eukprot:CAMPEP_0202357150 /NCGR_PEP_ID=MMETSP1126-20121109/11294_1 /ASSEMBLY_ACC=CAM_ASM_000457 /TAXON_ID=3047 /ORGANISM="Dunaliella tertiolecta, Strain CCMP1320" /LENGTH=342 /DNA_ID=CAMNT_0048949977 /DNA_START=92 /DNA_END=1120 /DNA_ORIENTATION=-
MTMLAWIGLIFTSLVPPIVLILVGLLPRGSSRRISYDWWPSLFHLYLQAAVAVIRKSGGGPIDVQDVRTEPPIEVAMVKPQPFDKKRLSKFLRLSSYPDSMQGVVPLMYPICESFRLNIQALLHPAFPFSVLRTVLKSISTTMYREVTHDEALVYRVQIDPKTFTRTDKGHIEVDIASMASSSKDNALVWRSTVRAVVLNPKAAKGGGAAAAQLDQDKLQIIDTWKHKADVGRKYGALNGDLNPIHLHSALSKMFGFKRPIAHALFQLSCTEASIRKHGIPVQYPIQMDVDCKRPTLLPATLHCALDKRSSDVSGDTVRFAVLTEDKAKEVLVGSLFKPGSQ